MWYVFTLASKPGYTHIQTHARTEMDKYIATGLDATQTERNVELRNAGRRATQSSFARYELTGTSLHYFSNKIDVWMEMENRIIIPVVVINISAPASVSKEGYHREVI